MVSSGLPMNWEYSSWKRPTSMPPFLLSSGCQQRRDTVLIIFWGLCWSAGSITVKHGGYLATEGCHSCQVTYPGAFALWPA